MVDILTSNFLCSWSSFRLHLERVHNHGCRSTSFHLVCSHLTSLTYWRHTERLVRLVLLFNTDNSRASFSSAGFCNRSVSQSLSDIFTDNELVIRNNSERNLLQHNERNYLIFKSITMPAMSSNGSSNQKTVHHTAASAHE